MRSLPELPAEYVEHYRRHAHAIRERLAEFRSVHPAEYIYELLYCLLTPQSRAVHADAVVAELRARDFVRRPFDPTMHLRDPAHYIRFHNQKARRLVAVAGRHEEITQALTAPSLGSHQRRAWLVENIEGLGWKEASHFLRNIGVPDLAIIDRHILKHLTRCGAIDAPPATLTPKRYFDLEARFRLLAERAGLELQELDLLFWSFEEGSVRK